jgi:hypothetical protein
VEDLENKFPATQEEKKIMQHTIEKKKFIPKRALEKVLVHRLSRFCIFEQAHLLKRTHGMNSGQHHMDSTAFGAYDSQWCSLAKLLPPPRKFGLKICTSL